MEEEKKGSKEEVRMERMEWGCEDEEEEDERRGMEMERRQRSQTAGRSAAGREEWAWVGWSGVAVNGMDGVSGREMEIRVRWTWIGVGWIGGGAVDGWRRNEVT